MPTNENFTGDQLNLIQDSTTGGTATGNFVVDNGYDYIRMAVFEDGVFTDREFFSNVPLVSNPSVNQLTIYENEVTTEIFVKPNEILDINGVPSGNYLLQFDFLRDIFNNINHQTGEISDFGGDLTFGNNPRFYIAEISPSRKEVRLYGRQGLNTSIPFTSDFKNTFETKIGTYRFDHVLVVSKARNLAIVNIEFDTISDPDNYSIVIRLNQPLPNDVKKLDECSIAKEIFVTQTQSIIYVSDVQTTIIGAPLDPDTGFEHDSFNYVGNDGFENKNELLLTASLAENTIQDIVYKLKQKDKNLNIDYNDFKNHIHFGSAEQKLKNFKTKVVEINDHLGELSASLWHSASNSSHSSSLRIGRRQKLFEKIQNIYEDFTPYERFLYTDGQSQTTASAPGLGTNYAKPFALNKVLGSTTAGTDVTSSKLSNYDGFSSVYSIHTKAKDETDEGINSNEAKVFDGVYLAEEPPFFNRSGSVYLSFLMKSENSLNHKNTNKSYDGGIYNRGVKLPEEALATQSIQFIDNDGTYTQSVLHSGYDRFIFVASQSYWRATPNTTAISGSVNIPEVGDLGLVTNFDGDGIDTIGGYNIFAGPKGFTTFPPNNPSSSYQQDTTGDYGYLLQPKLSGDDGVGEDYNLDTNTPRSGSYVLPAGDLFAIRISSSLDDSDNIQLFKDLENSASYITDVKVTYNNPLNTLPFGTIYHTGSTEWTQWYDGMTLSASAYDDINIHSFENNLPAYIQNDKLYNDLRLFLNMIGEKYDEIRTYIDNESSFYSTSYKNYNETGSNQSTIPDNILPMIAANFGWEFINPYTGSLVEYFSLVSHGGARIEEIKNETWRKVLNNLIYIYKSKGTLNSINALLHTYGYPENSLRIRELGGDTNEMNPSVFTDETIAMKDGLFRQTGSTHYIKKGSNPFYLFNFTGDKQLNLDWYTNNADGETIEFVFKGNNKSGSNQVLVESSGSGTLTGSSTLWDIRVIPSASHMYTASLQFRLNNSLTGALAIAENGLSMSTDYLPLTNDRLWNVMLQRSTASVDSTISQSYKLYVGYQNGDKIQHFTTASMDIDGNNVDGIYSASNANFISTGSLTIAEGSASSNVSGNLIIGRTLTGSMAEFRNWGEILSASKFKQHILNKFSVVGNSLTSSIDNVAYRFRLNENYPSASMESDIVDANPDGLVANPIDYSRNMNVATGSYSLTYISTFGLPTRMDIYKQENSAKSIIKPKLEFIRPLNPIKRSVRTVYEKQKNQSGPSRVVSKNIEIVKSISDRINDYTTNEFSDFDLTDFIGHPQAMYSSSYGELDNFREKAHKGIVVDVNKFVEANKDFFNTSLISSLKGLLPASTIGSSENIGIIIEPTSLQRSKHKWYKPSADTESIYTGNIFHMYYEESGSLSGSYNKDLYIFNLSESAYIQPYINENPFYMYAHDSGSVTDYLFSYSQSSFVQPYDVIESINFGGDSGSYFHLITGSYFAQYNMKRPLYMFGKDSGSIDSHIFNTTGSIYLEPYKQMNEIHFGGTSGSYFNIITGSYFTQYNMIKPIYMYGKDSGSKTDYIFDMSESILSQPYNFIEPIRFHGDSGSYFNITTGSYFTQYNMLKPIYMYGKSNSGSKEDYLFSLTGSEYITSYNFIEPIRFHGDSGSYFNITTGSYFQQYEMGKPIYMYGKDSGSNDDYLFELTSSLITPISGSSREVVDTLGLFNGTRRFRDGTHFTTDSASGAHRSYIWDAWGTGSSDVWFMHGTASQGGYYNSTFEFKLIGDIETWSSSFHLHGTGSDSTDISRLDYSDIHVFNNKLIVDTNKGFSHKGYYPSGSDDGTTNTVGGVDSSSFTDGRPLGRTHYFATSSEDVGPDQNASGSWIVDGLSQPANRDPNFTTASYVKPAGTILYPPNHYLITGTSKNSMGNNSDHMNSRGYVGSQHPVPSRFLVLEGGYLSDPLHLTENSSSVDANDVVGSSTDQAIVVVNQGGIQTGGGG